MGSDYSDSDSSANSSGYGKKHKKEKKEKKDKDKKGDKEKKDKHKDKDEKKDKAKKDKDNDKHKQKGDGYSYGLGSSSSNSSNTHYNNLTFPSAAHGNYDISGSHNPVSTYGKAPAISPSSFPSLGFTGLPQPQPQPPAAAAPAMSFGSPPPSGYRIPLDSGDGQPFPSNIQETGPPAAHDLDGSPIFLGSVLFHNAVHPCKIGPHLHPPAQVAYGGGEVGHNGRYDLLPFVPEEMEWVVTGNGRIPEGRRPVEGGYEEDGSKLYHALAEIEGLRVPGKTGEHLGGCNVGFGGREHSVQSGYEILCWRY